MSDWALLLRAVNLGPRNKLPMADLRALLTELGYGEVRTFLNSGNAVFTSSKRSPAKLASEIEATLRETQELDVRALVRTPAQLQAALDGLPDRIAKAEYVALAFLFEPPTAATVKGLVDWDVGSDLLEMGDGVVYLGFDGQVHTSKLQSGPLEKRLGVPTTARTPATIRKMLA